MSVRLRPPGVDAAPVDVPDEQVDAAIARGWKPLSAGEASTFETTPGPDTSLGAQANAAIGEGLSTATFGASDVLIDQLGTRAEREYHEKVRRDNPGATIVGGAIGAIADPFGAASAAGKLGGAAARGLEEGGTLAQLAGAGVKAGTEGALFGAGAGVSQLALSDDPLSMERVASVIGTNALFGAATGGAIGVAGKGLGKGLSRAKEKLDEIAAKGLDTTVDAGADLATLDRKGLRTAQKLELEAIEAARVPKRAELADEIKSLRGEMKQNKLWLATKDAEEAEIRAIGKRTLKADRQLDNILDDPKALAENPKSTLSALRKQEAALDDLVNKHGDALRTKFAGDTSGTRATALDYASVALEKNRALQAKIAEVSSKPTSARLEAIADHMAMGPAAAKSAGAMDALGDAAMGYGLGMVAGLPGLGAVAGVARVAAPILRKLGASSAAAAERASKGVQTFLNVGEKVAPVAPVVATKVLSGVRYAFGNEREKKSKKPAELADLYNARSAEIRALTAPGPDGKPQMRPEKRAQLAAQLAPLHAVSPLLADRVETNKADGYAFLAGKLPKMPDLPGMSLGSKWQPADMLMRGWARYAAAVEDPYGVIDRLASGQVTPEDAETMKTVYPELYADVQRQIMEQLGELQKLPYQRRLALSIFSDIPVDPAMDPRVLAMLQGQFEAEEGSEGGTQAPTASPQFGSVSREQPTPSQERSAG